MAAEDYFSSGLRLFQDSQDLYARERFDSAAYLAGYTLECGLKALLQAPTGRPVHSYGHDVGGMSVHALWLAALLSPTSGRYRVDGISTLAQATAYWNPDLRYRTTGDVNKENAKLMVDTAQDVVALVFIPLLLDGVEKAGR